MTIVGSLLVAFVALFGIYVKLWVDRAEQETRTFKLIAAEFRDIARHYNRNVGRIATMLNALGSHEMWPDQNHIEKLRWPETTYIFSDESVKYSQISRVKDIYTMRLRLRNANLDTDAALRAFATSDAQIFSEALSFVDQRHRRILQLALSEDIIDRREIEKLAAVEIVDYQDASDMLFYPRPILSAIDR